MDKHEPNDRESTLETIAQELQKTNGYMRRAYSLHWVLLRGMITGFAIVLGSTVVVGVVVSMLRTLIGDISLGA